MGFGEGVSTAGAASTPPAGFWHYLVVTYDGTTERGYTNAVLNAQEAKNLNLWVGDPVTIGQSYEANFAYATGIPFSGSLMALRVHSGVLTPAQISANYASGIASLAAEPAQIAAAPATGVSLTSATLNGQLMSVSAPTDVTVYFGTADARTNKAGWTSSASVGQLEAGAFATDVAGLAPLTTYYYRCYGSNVNGDAWSTAVSFTTPGLPSVATLPAKAVLPTSARLMGNLAATNLLPTVATLYWGPTDGGTDPAQWASVWDLGVRPVGELVVRLSGLTSGASYSYRYYASNAAGAVWASSSQSFTTPPVFDRSGFNYTMPVTFSGYTSNDTLVNFPALVVLSPSIPGFDYAQVASGGNDLRFVSSDGGELNYEIESWDPAGDSFIWVQVPELTPGATINMIWGKGGLAAPPGYTGSGGTWNDGFAGVWHMTNSYVKDSSGNGRNGSSIVAPTAVTDTVGLIGRAQDYNAAIGNGATSVGDIDLTDMTLSAWVWLRDANREGIFICKDGVIFFWQQGANLRAEALPWGGDTTAAVANSGGVGQWIYVAATVNGTTQTFYTNGLRVGSWTKAVPSLNDNPMMLGGVSWGRIMNGKLDEVRAERVARSAAWVKANYFNQLSPASFETFGTVSRLFNPLSVGAPAVTGIDLNAATASVWANGDGGNGLTSWGTMWDTSPAPLANAQVETGITSAPFQFAQTLAGLTPGVHVYVRGFASNAVDGLSYSPDTEFFTEPEAVSDVTISAVGNNSLTISWIPNAGAAGALVLVRENSAVTAVPVDGATYTANTDFEMGADLGGRTYVVHAGADSAVTVNGLVPNTTYHVAVFAYAGSGALINYQQDTPAAASQTTANEPGFAVAGMLPH